MKRLLLMTIAVLMLTAGISQTAQAANWTPDFGVSPPADSSTSVQDASVVPREGGGFIYVWTDIASSAPGIRTRVSYPDGHLGPVHTIFSGFYLSIPLWSAAAGSGNNNRVAFLFRSKGCSACQYSYDLWSGKLDPDGKLATGAPQNVKSVGPSNFEAIYDASLSVAPDGSALLAWTQQDNSGNDLLGFAVAPQGGMFTAGGIDPADTSFYAPQAAARSGGGGYVAFGSSSGGPAMSGVTISAAGAAGAVTTLGSGNSGNQNRTVVDSTGKATVVFGQMVDSDYGLYYRQVGSDGTPIGADATAIQPSGEWRFYDQGSLALDSSGRAAIGWLTENQAGTAYFPVAASISSAGILESRKALGEDALETNDVQLAFDKTGPVAFTSVRVPADNGDFIYFQRLGADLTPTGAQSIIANHPSDDTLSIYPPAYAENGDGSLPWITGVSGLGSQLDASIYDNTGPAFDTWIPTAMTQGLETVLGAQASDPSGATVTWDFGDGSTGTGNYVKHTWSNTGTFNVKVTATDGLGNVTSKTTAVPVVAVPDPNPGPPPPDPVIPPDTKITGQPAKSTKSKTATFKFISSLTGSKFECRLDKAGWTDCRSPKKLKNLKPGKHTFKIRAIKGELFEATPASYAWTVKKTKKKKN